MYFAENPDFFMFCNANFLAQVLLSFFWFGNGNFFSAFQDEENLVIPIHAYPVMNADDFPNVIDFSAVPVGHL